MTSRRVRYLGSHRARRSKLSLAGAVRDAKVLVTLHYEEGNRRCEVDLYVDKAVLHD